VADYQVPARIRRLRIEDRQPLPGLSVVEAERRLDFLSAGDGLINATYADTRRFPPYPQVITDFVSAATATGLAQRPGHLDGGQVPAGVDPGLQPGAETDRIGAVKPGYCADLLVVRGDPVSSITAIRSVALVIKSGRIVFAENPAASSPPGM
jgi:hypothetical protein